MPRPSFARLTAALSLVLALSLALTVPTTARADFDAETRAVIEQQLEAFQRDDFDQAYEYASPGIQRIFPSPGAFQRMVIGQYPMIWRPRDVEFLGAERRGGVAQRMLRIVDQSGVAWTALYTLETIDGVWRISAVQIRRAPVAGA